jgi:TBC1 domain family member 20
MDEVQHEASSQASLPIDPDQKSGAELSTSSVTAEPQSAKAVQIREACEKGDVPALISLATSTHGLLNDELRQAACNLLLFSVPLGNVLTRLQGPILLGCNEPSSYQRDRAAWSTLPAHSDEEQVEKDVDRAFVYYPSHESENQVAKRKEQLYGLIVQVLRSWPRLSYFQGYHDIVQVFLLVLGLEPAVSAVERLSLLRIRDFMLPALGPATLHLRLLPAILYAADPELCNHLRPTQPFYALSATLTLYAHDIQEYGDIARLFDFLLASEAVASVYLYAAVRLVPAVDVQQLTLSTDHPRPKKRATRDSGRRP